MNMNEKKVYTWEDNIRGIAFGIRDMLKKLDEISQILRSMSSSDYSDKNEMPF